jgi:phosphate acyltransferase
MSNVTIAVDVMGGDKGLKATMPGCALALKHAVDFKLILVGDESKVKKAVRRYKLPEDRIEIVHAPEEVLMDDEPVFALRKKKQSSMRLAIDLVKEGRADACISAGNTGALMATAKFVLKTLPGISRPALISLMPGADKKAKSLKLTSSYMLDLGANIDCDAEQLCQFAVMGTILAQKVKKVRSPRVKLLNIGSEDFKGLDVIKEAAAILEDMPQVNYKGYIEANEIFFNSADVIVCDGFMGNIALKASEGLARFISSIIKDAFKGSWYYKPLTWLGYLFFSPVLVNMKNRLDSRKYNGASLLGLNGVVIKSHGNTDRVGFEYAVLEAVREAKGDISNQISAILAKKLKAGK